MIDSEILEIVTDAKDRGERLNEIVDQFRRGREVNQLIVLLDSGNSELVSIGTWILGELHFEFYNAGRFVLRLRELLDHKDPAVRFHAIGAVFPALNGQEVATQALLTKLRSDSNEVVRKTAEAAIARLSLTR